MLTTMDMCSQLIEEDIVFPESMAYRAFRLEMLSHMLEDEYFDFKNKNWKKDMNKNINLCEILKGHEGETFYSPVFGIAILKEMTNNYLCLKSVDKVINLYKDGRYDIHGECMLFPSKDQRDWNKWLKEQKSKVPKTWSDYIITNRDNFKKGICDYCIDVTGTGNNGWTRRNTPIEKSALALLKIHQLIEVGYGGNVTRSDYIDIHKKAWGIDYDFLRNNFYPSTICYSLVAFHTEEQAEEFLKYPENVQLLKDYFMI